MARALIRTPRRRKEWSALLGNILSISGAGTSAGSSLAFSQGGHTVMRMMGEYTIGSIAAPVAGDREGVTVAIGVVSSDAAAAGAGSLPDPASEPEYPWLFWASHSLHYPSTGIQEAFGLGAVHKSFDVRSQRKMSPRESLIVVMEVNGGLGDPPLQLNMGLTRVLLALP